MCVGFFLFLFFLWGWGREGEKVAVVWEFRRDAVKPKEQDEMLPILQD